jgi:3-deoxy-D-manno-octulosonate 8-phosphate phosphatase (KDO 8-P phosphatase)
MPHPAEQIRLLCLDVDGVMTDGSIMLDDNGVETKRFHVRDGTGIKIWTRLGYHVAIVTGRRGSSLMHRAKELGIEHIVQGSKHKLDDLEPIMKSLGVSHAQTAMLADDLPDLPIMRVVGYPMAVADAVDEIRQAASFVTERCGGNAAVREAVEHLMRAKREWPQAVDLFRS